jgi:hypothetical protein
MGTAPARGNEQILMQMLGKGSQYRVRLAGGVHCRGQAGVQPLNSDIDRAGGPLRTFPAQPGTQAQVLRYLLQLAQRLGLHWLDFVPVLEHPLQFALAAPQGPHRRRVLQAHDSLMQGFGRTGRLAEPLPGVQCQRHAVDGLRRWMQQQVGDVQRAQLMFEVGLPAFKVYFPGIRLSAQGILASIRVTAIRACLVCFHNSCHPYGGKKNLPVSGSLPSGRDTDFTDSHGLSPELRDHSCHPCLTPYSPLRLGVKALEPNAQVGS